METNHISISPEATEIMVDASSFASSLEISQPSADLRTKSTDRSNDQVIADGVDNTS